MLRNIDMFSGYGGFTLGLERSGLSRTVAFAEIDPYASAVLAKHWPSVPNLGDVQTGISAGFPCQDISNAGLRAGITGPRSGLWRSVGRAIRLVRPILVHLENVAALLRRGMGVVLGDLASDGYDAEWDCLPASFVGAPHDRDRAWLVAYAQRRERWQEPYLWALGRMGREQQSVPWDEPWESALRRLRGVDDGTAYGVDRVDTLRNGLVPQIPELIGRAILASMNEQRDAA